MDNEIEIHGPAKRKCEICGDKYIDNVPFIAENICYKCSNK